MKRGRRPTRTLLNLSGSFRWEVLAAGALALLWLFVPGAAGRVSTPSLLGATLLCVLLLLLRLKLLGGRLREEQSLHDHVKRRARVQEAANTALLGAVTDHVFCLDAQGQVTALLPAPAAQEGAFAPQVSEALRDAARAVLETGSMRTLRLSQEGEGGARELEARLTPYVSGRALALVRDVTAKTRLLAELSAARATALEAARLKTKFLANMSHEIRTPMNGVIGMTNLLLETPLSAEQSEYAQIIQKSGQALLLIIDDILDFAKIEAGKLELEDVAFELSACVDACVEACAAQAHAKGLELGAVYEAGLPQRVRGDPTRLRQILANLLSNAVRYTEQGSVVVHVESAERGLASRAADTASSARICFTVQDSGPGIARERLPQLFQPVLLGDGAGPGSAGGTGLGLVIVRELVQLMGGEIECRSSVGVGTTFEFTLLLGAEAEAPQARAGTPQSSGGAWVGTVRSGGAVPWLLTEQLSELDVQGVPLDPQHMLSELLAEQRPRPCLALIVDARLPSALLTQLVSELRREPRSAETALVLVAGPQLDLPEALRAEAARVLSWPVRQAELGACLAALQQRPEPALGGARRAVRSTVRSSVGSKLRAHVLIADDDEINQRVLRRLLSQLGCTYELAGDGAVAVERALGSRFDAVLMDCQMPQLDGFEAARQIRAGEQGAQRTRIVAMTGSTADEDRQHSVAAGMDGFLIKPISRDQLLAELSRLLGPSTELAELALSLVETTPRSLEAMRAALEVHDLAAVARSARQLRGLAEALEEGSLHDACAELADAAELADVPAAERALARVCAEHVLSARRWRPEPPLA